MEWLTRMRGSTQFLGDGRPWKAEVDMQTHGPQGTAGQAALMRVHRITAGSGVGGGGQTCQEALAFPFSLPVPLMHSFHVNICPV